MRAATGEPIADASVCASCVYPQCGEMGAPALHCAATDADGRYALGGLSVELRYGMLAIATEYRPAPPVDRGELFLRDGSPRHVDFILHRGGAQIAGTLVDAYGGTIAGGLVVATELQGGLTTMTRSAADGRFALPLEEGPWDVRASATGYDSTSALLHAPSDGAELVLAAAGSIRGRVVSAADGTGVPDVEVRATRYARLVLSPGDGSATSDAAGNFLIQSLGAGSYELIARGARWYGSASERRHLAIGEQATGIEIRVRPAATVEGRVVLEPGDEPCRNGSVYFTTAVGKDPIEAGFAALARIAEGAVVIEGVPTGEYRVQVTCHGFLSRAEYERVQVAAAGVRNLRWPVTQGLRITGQLVDAHGRGVPARIIQATPEGENGHGQAITSARGDFELVALAATRYRIAAEAAPESMQRIDLSEGRPLPSPLRLELRATGTMEVHLTPSAAPASAWVQALGRDTHRTAVQVAADRFELRDLPAGDYRIYASDGRNRPVEHSANVALGARTQVSLVLPPASAVLRGQVIDRNGSPVADASVSATPNRTPTLPGAALTSAVLTQVDGTFVIPNLIAGDRYNVQAEHHGDGEATLLDAMPGATIVLRLTGPS